MQTGERQTGCTLKSYAGNQKGSEGAAYLSQHFLGSTLSSEFQGAPEGTAPCARRAPLACLPRNSVMPCWKSRSQDVLMGFRPFISSNTPLHFGHLMMCDARRISSFGRIL